MEDVKRSSQRIRRVHLRKPACATKHRLQFYCGAFQTTASQIVIYMGKESLELIRVYLGSSFQEAKGVSDLEIVNRHPRDGDVLSQLPACTLRVRFVHVDGDQGARVEINVHLSPRSCESC